jgi:hypothetical protein
MYSDLLLYALRIGCNANLKIVPTKELLMHKGLFH